jgi:hypothetical protein
MPMVTLTPEAGALLQRVQAAQPTASGLRLVADENGLVIGTSAPAPRDLVLFHDGVPVLRIAADTADRLAGYVIATRTTADGEELTLLAPGEDTVPAEPTA